MGISHADHDHPATPAARAACRRAMGGNVPEKGSEKPAAGRKRRAGTSGHPRGLKRSGTTLRAIHDLADVPHVFGNVIRLAWDREYQVTVGEQFTEGDRRVVIHASHGEVSLVWRESNPTGVNGVFFRPYNSSLTQKVSTVNGALRLAEGEEE